MLTEQDRTEIKQIIKQEIETTKQVLAEQKEDNKSIAPDKAIGRISRMDAMYNQQLNTNTLQRTYNKIAKLEYILEKVDTPEFGLCEFCNTEISLPRLKAMPESTVCMRCAAFAG